MSNANSVLEATTKLVSVPFLEADDRDQLALNEIPVNVVAAFNRLGTDMAGDKVPFLWLQLEYKKGEEVVQSIWTLSMNVYRQGLLTTLTEELKISSFVGPFILLAPETKGKPWKLGEYTGKIDTSKYSTGPIVDQSDIPF